MSETITESDTEKTALDPTGDRFFWAILELMGHQREVGLVREITFAGAGFIQVVIPQDPEESVWRQRLFSPAAIYAINPCLKEEALSRMFPISRPSAANPGSSGWDGDDADPYCELLDEGDESEESE